MGEGRYGVTGNGGVRSRDWTENMPSMAQAEAPSGRDPLVDPCGRQLDYLRLAVTDRCNLRCRYCMPAEGLPLGNRAEVLDLEELEELVSLFLELGVRKLRITGGEPLLRRGLVPWLALLGRREDAPEILLTTNGLRLGEHLEGLVEAGVRRVNVSLDSLRPETFRRITRRDGCEHVLAAIDRAAAAGLHIKLNVVAIPGVNDGEFGDFVDLVRERDLTVRFIEPMPFDGSGGEPLPPMGADEILARLRLHADLRPVAREGVADLYGAPDLRGRLGIIAGHTRTFCSDCSRLRVDARGRLRTCLYGDVAVELRPFLRAGDRDALENAIRAAVARRAPDGFAAQRLHDRHRTSMAGIGG